MREFNLVTCLLFLMLPGFAQTPGFYPDQFSSYFYNPSLINPAYIPNEGNSEAIIQSKLRSGMYSEISTIAAAIQKTFSNGTQWHSGRIILLNEKEGPYISTPRAYLNYGTRVNIREDLHLLAGIAIGLVNPNYRTPTKTISTVLTDGALGLIVRYKNTSLGVSSNQIFNNSSDISSAIRLKRYYNTFFETRFALNYQVDLKCYILWRKFSDIPSQYTLASSVFIKEKIEAGIGYNYKRGAFFYSSVIIDHAGKHPLKLGFLYNSIILSNSPILGEAVELSLSYSY